MKRFETLENERIIVEQGIHWKNYLAPMALMSICVFSLIFRAYFPEVSLINRALDGTVVPARYQPVLSGAEIALLGALALACVVSMIRTSLVRYYITDKRVVAVSGLLTINTSEMLLERIESVYIKQNIYERLYDCGDVLCVAPGSQVFLDDVADAGAFRNTILNMTRQSKRATE